jgi:hypothetical protein
MQKIKHIVLICWVLLLASCASTKYAPEHKQVVSQRAQVVLTLDQHEYKTNCLLKVQKNELIILSVLPIMGIEMFRLEATPKGVAVFDKLNKRYTELTYAEINNLSPRRISFKTLLMLTKKIDKDILFDFKAGSHTLKLKGTFSQHEQTTQKELQTLDRNKYKRVGLREILPI